MTEKPILFSAPMVRAILAGKKTMTRRVIKPQPECITDKGIYIDRKGSVLFQNKESKLGKYQVGNVLWVREKFQIYPAQEFLSRSREMKPYEKIPKQKPESYYVEYAAEQEAQRKWRLSIHMPRWVARLFLKIRGVRVERLQDISNADVRKEGICGEEYEVSCENSYNNGNCTFRTKFNNDCNGCFQSARAQFSCLWDTLNAKRGYGWESNPWVWVYEFERVEAPKDVAE
jgi:hypothetical protein